MADIVTFGSDKPPWRPSRRLIVAGAVVLALLAGGAAVVALAGRGGPARVAPQVSAAPRPVGPPCRATGVTASLAAGPPAALALDCDSRHGASLDRRDPTAAEGPWTVVVRRVGGSVGRHGAVVTFPVAAPPAGRRVAVGGATGTAGPGTVTWPIAGAYARIRGDLTESELIAIGAATSVVGGRPAANPPAGYAVAGAGPYRPPDIHEIRYGTVDLGEGDALGGGLTFTGVARGGGFEDQLYAGRAGDGGLVGGRPAVVSSVFGGNGALAWEPEPGVLAYVGYSGAMMDERAVAALQRLAGRSRTLTGAQWEASGPQTIDQTNEPG